MYSTCIFCHADLDKNEVIEHFPVGRRLAFDASKGRLWVVCRKCERWNLTPLESRWEAIEACEALYRETRLRVATDNIGLARLREGLELVRIGSPLRPEFAAWRYGDQFGRRRKRAIILGTGAAVAVGSLIVGASAAGVSLSGFSGMWWNIPQMLQSFQVARIRGPNNEAIKLRGRALRQVRLVRGVDGGPELILKHRGQVIAFTGQQALDTAGRLLPSINPAGGSKRAVADAVAVIERERGAEGYIEHYLDDMSSPVTNYTPIATASTPARLALEMALHEEAERRAIEGELTALEATWREAEEIAHIADNLFVSPTVDARLQALKGDEHDDATG